MIKQMIQLCCNESADGNELIDFQYGGSGAFDISVALDGAPVILAGSVKTMSAGSGAVLRVAEAEFPGNAIQASGDKVLLMATRALGTTYRFRAATPAVARTAVTTRTLLINSTITVSSIINTDLGARTSATCLDARRLRVQFHQPHRNQITYE